MTETEEVKPVEEPILPVEEVEPEAVTEEVHCHWCGVPHELVDGDDEDWLCDNCERYQDAMACPTCHQLARKSMLPQDMQPAAHAPSRRRKARE